MARLLIDHSEASDAAKLAGRASQELTEYAESITSNVNNALGGLTGGQTGYTSNAASLAQQKAQALRKKADTFSTLQRRITTFNEATAEADKSVASHIDSVKGKDSENLTWYQKVFSNVYSLYQGTIGQTGLGKVLNGMAHGVKTNLDLGVTAVQKAYDFFVYGDGKYVLNIIGSVVAAVTAVALFVGACLTGAGIVVVIAAAVAAVVAVLTTVATCYDNGKALGMSGDDPGAAAYYGDTDSLNSWAKKHIYDQGTQNVALGIDITGKVAGIVRDVGAAYQGLELDPFNSKDFNKVDSTKATGWKGVGQDIAGKFGFKWDENGKRSWQFGKTLQSVIGYKFGDEDSSVMQDIGYTIKDVNKVSGYLQDGGFTPFTARQRTLWRQRTGSDIGKDILKHTPVLKDVYDVGKDYVDLHKAGSSLTELGLGGFHIVDAEKFSAASSYTGWVTRAVAA